MGNISSPKRLRPMESRWGWGCLGAFRTSRIRLLGHLPSRCMPLCSKLTSCLTISSLFPQYQPRQGTFTAEAGRVFVLREERVECHFGKLGPPPKVCCLCTDSKSIKQQLINPYFVFHFFFASKCRLLLPTQAPSTAVPLFPS